MLGEFTGEPLEAHLDLHVAGTHSGDEPSTAAPYRQLITAVLGEDPVLPHDAHLDAVRKASTSAR